MNLSELSMKIRMLKHPGRTKVNIGSNSAKFYVKTRSEYNRFYDINDERPVIEDICQEVNEGDLFWDVGANVGLYSCIIGQLTDVIAFEPLEENVERIKQNKKLNKIEFEVDNRALSDQTGKSNLVVTGEEAGEGKSHLGEGDREIYTVRGDELPAPDVVKIDVEGAEQKVIDGMQGIINEIRTIYVEEHDGVSLQLDRDYEVIHERGNERFLKFS